MEQNMTNEGQWQELQRASIPYLKECRVRYTPKAVRDIEQAVSFLVQRQPDLPFQAEEIVAETADRWSRLVRKRLLFGIKHFGRWAENRTGIVLLQS